MLFMGNERLLALIQKVIDEEPVSAATIAERGGFHASVISKMKSNSVSMPDVDTLVSIARGLRRSISQVFYAAAGLPYIESGSEIQELVGIYETLDEMRKLTILALARELASTHNKNKAKS